MKLITAQRVDKNTITYHTDKGVTVINKGGSEGWRRNNPLMMKDGAYSKKRGGISAKNDHDTEAAVFPNQNSAFNAFFDLLKSSEYKNLTLKEALKKMTEPAFAERRPQIDISNLPEALKKLGDKIASKKVEDLNAKEFSHVFIELRKHNGYDIGAQTKQYPVKWSSLGWDQREEYLPKGMWTEGGFTPKNGEKPTVYQMKNGQIVKMFNFSQMETDPKIKQSSSAESYASDQKYKIGNDMRNKEEIKKIDDRNRDPFGEKDANDYSAGL